MAVARSNNYISQQRVDVPHLRAIESAICNDLDTLAGTAMTGQAPLVVSGLHVVTTGITQATSLVLQTADSVFINFNATASGSIFHIPANTPDDILSNSNSNIVGNWTASAVNYVGIDIFRAPDGATTDLVEVMDTIELVEQPVPSPLAVTAQYQIVITTSDFDANPSVCPIMKVTLDAGGAITAIQDCRNFLFRLALGGTTPNTKSSFSWPGGRAEQNSIDPFGGADKTITAQKQWNDAAMTRMWELGGGEYWYSPTADKNVRLAHTGSPLGTGDYFGWDGTNLLWKGLVLIFDNSTATFNVVADQTTSSPGLTDLVSGECIYVDVDRTQNRSGGNSLVAVKGALSTLGSPLIPGSRWVLAWNYGGSVYTRDQAYAVGSTFQLATISAAGMVKLSATDSAAVSPTAVATVDSVSKLAAAGGVSRGHGDFIGGAGDIQIGGDTLDHSIKLTTTRGQDSTIITGTEVWTSTFNAPLMVQNLSPFDQEVPGTASIENVIAMFRGYKSSSSQIQTAVTIEGNGPIGMRAVAVSNPIPPPTPTATNPIQAKIFITDNGLSAGNNRDQFCALDVNGKVTVLWESTRK